MSINFNSTQGYFPRVGALIAAFQADVQRMSNQTVSPTNATLGGYPVKSLGNDTSQVRAQFTSTNLDILDGWYSSVADRRTATSGWLTTLQGLVEAVGIEMAHDDVTLVNKTKDLAVAEIIRQMESGNVTVKKNVTSASVAAVSTNTGNCTVAANITGPDGVNREYVFAETIDIVIDSDSGRGGTAGSETATITGEPAVDPLDWNWPLGSGAGASITVTDPGVDAGQNLLTNSDFEDFTSGLPDDWTVVSGTNATIGSSGVSYIPSGSTSLKFVGNGSAIQTIKQPFTSGVLEPNRVYATNFAVQANASCNGTISISLVNNTTLAVINDDEGTANTLSIDMSLQTTSWNANNTFFFRTPKSLPSAGVAFCINTTQAMNATAYLQGSMCEATETYPGGPFLAVFRGSVDPIVGDKWEATISNDFGGKLQTNHDRLLDMKSMGLQLPSSASPSINETLWIA